MSDATADDWSWVNDSDDWVPPAVDTSRPSVARMYDYYLGGKDHFAVDREAAQQMLTVFPDIADAARANREFMVGAVRAMTAAGIEQFLDLGTGIPTSPSVHEVAREARPGARVVYVDHDPVVMAHNRALLAEDQHVVTVRQDMRDPAAVLDDPAVRGLLDFDRPIGLLMIAVLHFVDVSTGPLITGRYYAALPAGSQVAVTVGTLEGVAENRVPGEDVYARSNAPIHLRTRAQVQELLDGLDVVPPGIDVVHRFGEGAVLGARAVKERARRR